MSPSGVSVVNFEQLNTSWIDIPENFLPSRKSYRFSNIGQPGEINLYHFSQLYLSNKVTQTLLPPELYK